MLNPQDRDHLLKASDGSTFTIGLQRRRWLVLMAAMHFASMHAYKTAMSKWRQPTSAAPKAILRGMPTRVCPGLELPAEVIFSDFLYRVFKLNGRLRVSRRAVERLMEGEYPVTTTSSGGLSQSVPSAK